MAKQHGIITVIAGLSGAMVVNNLVLSESVEIAKAQNESGYVTDRKAYSKKTTAKVDGLLDTATIPASAVSAGASLTVSGKAYLIENCDITQSHVDYAKVSLTASSEDASVDVPYTPPSAG